jgi:hypothetical protein
MRKKKTDPSNKSMAIRNYKKAHPNSKPRHIVEGLGKQGITVTANYVSSILSSSSRTKKKRGRKVGKPARAGGRPRAAATEEWREGMRLAKQLLAQLNAKDAIEVIKFVDELRA